MSQKLSKHDLKIAVLGLGHWGTALAHHLATKGFPVTAWSRNEEVVKFIDFYRYHPNLLSDIQFPENLKATTKLNDLEDADILLSVLPAKALSEVFVTLTLKPEAIFISATKGLDPHSKKFPVELAKQLLPGLKAYAVISGPGFAKDIAAQNPAGLVMACEQEDICKELAKIFATPNLRIYTTSDVLGVELGGVVKNIIAIAAGISDGLELGESARAGLITRGLAEMMRLAKALNAHPQTLAGLSGLGDLVLTATSDHSRNRQVGLHLGQGRSLEETLELVGSTAEGVLATTLIEELGDKLGLQLPITTTVSKLLAGEIDRLGVIESLLLRPLKPEFH